MQDERRTISEFPRYTIDRRGIVRNGEKVLSGGIRKGYHYVVLRQDGRRGDRAVHRLLLRTFHREPRSGEICRHLNDNPLDNRLENLAWGTEQDNSNDAKRNGLIRRGEGASRSKLTEADVLEMRRRALTEQANIIALDYDLHEAYVRSVINGRRWKYLPGAVKKKPGPPKKAVQNIVG